MKIRAPLDFAIVAASIFALIPSSSIADDHSAKAEDPADIPVAEVVPAAKEVPIKKMHDSVEVVPLAKVTPNDDEETTSVDLVKADRNDDGKLTEREVALHDHRAQLSIYDLNDDKKISNEEWKAANREKRERNEKFFLVDKNEDGQIDEDEAIRFVMERISLSSTYIDAAKDENADIIEDAVEEEAPSEVRVTLFSIPLGD
ncbi:MAG: hypothetical protein P1U58_07990 [Verrucomicrobiales bacterium]|nr:hypothetical protein [Verrucomicrobiales bacterium]